MRRGREGEGREKRREWGRDSEGGEWGERNGGWGDRARQIEREVEKARDK